ncbi:hypothetical protein BDP27DRAFT_295130 [Rhodocollybia butyracea]|uniref:Uncharacterized protein n=1 Tax=Rhodocollybia butyracea TaxID=206335 RepID=A0A9P5U1E5_9AGAR|nr:hypothetical protein BDP27DRAFT_295130 [Rhodocollybia butyracea]
MLLPLSLLLGVLLCVNAIAQSNELQPPPFPDLESIESVFFPFFSEADSGPSRIHPASHDARSTSSTPTLSTTTTPSESLLSTLVHATSSSAKPSSPSQAPPSHISTNNILGAVIGGVIGAIVFVLILLTYLGARRRQRARTHQLEDIQNAVYPFDASNDNGITTTGRSKRMVRHPPIADTARPTQAGMRETKHAMGAIAIEEQRGTGNLLNRDVDNEGVRKEITDQIEQRVSEILERIRRVEEVMTLHPPNYESRQDSA